MSGLPGGGRGSRELEGLQAVRVPPLCLVTLQCLPQAGPHLPALRLPAGCKPHCAGTLRGSARRR